VTDPQLDERRQHIRFNPKGTVIVMGLEGTWRGRITNLCAGGVFAAADEKPPAGLLGKRVDMELRLDGQLASWVTCSGHVVRQDDEGIAISFEHIPAMLFDVIDRMATTALARRRVISVLLVDSQTDRRDAMAHGFREVGCATIEASTPLEAIVRLGEIDFEPDVIAIADSMPETVSDELRRFVTREHPAVKLVMISPDTRSPVGILHWLSSTDRASDLTSRIRSMLVRPRHD
jgi:CheY-like chemotaxis protein